MKMYRTIICCIALGVLVNADPSVWKAVDVFDANKAIDIGRYAVLVLNRPINIPQKYIIKLWNEANYRAAAEGGTDRWYKFVSTVTPESQLTKIHPDLVVGDLDSIKPDTLQRCKENGVNIVRNNNPDNTDFAKGCEEIVKQNDGNIDSIIAVSENSGRLDHIMANLNTMYNTTKLFGTRNIHLYLLSTESLSWVLTPGSHNLHIPNSLVQSEATCGLIPLGAPTVVTTTGLKWNLYKAKMEFGGLISSSNTYRNGLVTIETDSPLLWTMEIIE